MSAWSSTDNTRHGGTCTPYIGHLLIIGGVEQNPGPGGEKNEVQAMETMKREIISEIRQMKTEVNKDIKDMKQDMRSIREQFAGVESTCREIKDQCVGLSNKVKSLETEVIDIREQGHIYHLDIDEINLRMETLEQRLEEISTGDDNDREGYARLEGEIDRLEEFSRRDNLVMHGLSETPDENYDTCREKVLNILNEHVKSKLWTDRDIIRAHRLGKTGVRPDRPRPMIVKFFHWRDKMCVLESRDSLGEVNYGVSNDRTWRQRQKLRELNDEGKSGYFRGGKLVIVNNDQGNTRGRGRGQGHWRGRGGMANRSQGQWSTRGGLANHSSDRPPRSQSETRSKAGARR